MSTKSQPSSTAEYAPSEKTQHTLEYGLVRDVSRRIVHVDLDSFYASVEQRDHPELRGRPVAVGHPDGRGVVATASYEARRFGVHSAMPSRQAKVLCPEIIFVEARISHYRAISEQIHDIFHRYTDAVEGISIDEAFLDVTHNKMGWTYGVEVAKAIKNDIRQELDLVASAGVSYCKFLAKIASDYRKPDGLYIIQPDRAQRFIDQLPVEKIWGVGPVTAKRLQTLGVETGKDLRAMSIGRLLELFGEQGSMLYHFARGVDNRPVESSRERKSVSCEETVEEDLRDKEAVLELLDRVAEDLSGRLARNQFIGRTLTLKLRYADFRTVSRTLSPATPYDANVERLKADGRMLLEGLGIPAQGIRLLGLRVGSRWEVDDSMPTLWDALAPNE